MRKVAREFSPGVIRQSSSLSFQLRNAVSSSHVFIHNTYISHTSISNVYDTWVAEKKKEMGGLTSLFSALLVPRMWTTMTNRETMLGATGKIPKNANNKNESLRSFCLVGGSAGGVSGKKSGGLGVDPGHNEEGREEEGWKGGCRRKRVGKSVKPPRAALRRGQYAAMNAYYIYL